MADMEYFLLKQTKALNLCPSSTERCFFKSCHHYLQQPARSSRVQLNGRSALFPCPAPPQSRWRMAEATHAGTSLVDLRGMTGLRAFSC